jgi:hypothetical protein
MEDPFWSNLMVSTIINAKEYWPSEVNELAPWVAGHLGALGALLGLRLELVAREVRVDDFSVDIEACDDRGRKVLVEVQFGPSDHRHLGQIVSYACTQAADAIIWVSAGSTSFRREPMRPGHRRALAVLNRQFRPLVEFYGVELEVGSTLHRLDEPEGPHAPRWSVVVRP